MASTILGLREPYLGKFSDGFKIHRRNEAIAAELGCNVRARPGQKIEVNATGCNLADPSHCLPSGCYEESMLNEYALKIIRAHDKSLPLFLFYAFHLVHSPMQVPSSYLQQIDDIVAQSG